MERVEVLIERLQAQYNNNASKESLLATTQLLLSELQKSDEEEDQYSSSVVSVFYPAYYQSAFVVEETVAELPEIKKEIKITDENVSQPEQPTNGEEHKKKEAYFDPIMEIPTLALKRQEVNDFIASNNESLNDKLKSSSSYKEIGHAIKDTPVKDLRKAIGVNDRYVFINELFRGDETMYERSIKTINSFNIYPEAEFWIKRELKLKLAWNDENEAVQLFDKLVKRRFA